MAARGGKEAWEGVICSFLVSENRQGVLLPDNTDPWKKLPDSIPEKKAVCTYLEMRGDYNDDGITISDMGFRMYLGNDATTDFDIVRNTAYTVTVGINDKATAEMLSWKVVPGTVDDKRTLRWSKNPDTLYCEKSLTVTPELSPSGIKLSYSFEGLEDAHVTSSVSGNTVILKSNKQMTEKKNIYVIGTTSDGRKSCKLRVVLYPRNPVSLEVDCPDYGGTGNWAWDFYKTAGKIISYTVKVFYDNGTSSIIPASEYSVSNNTRADLVNFSTNGVVGCVGGTDTGGDGTVKFSYRENGKTVSLTKNWKKIYVTSINAVNETYFGSVIPYCILHYNDGTEEHGGWSSTSLRLTSADSRIVEIDYNGDMKGVREGTVRVWSDNTFRGQRINQNVVCHKRPGIADTYGPSITSCKLDEHSIYCFVLEDADGCVRTSGSIIVHVNDETYTYSSNVTQGTIGGLISGKLVAGDYVNLEPVDPLGSQGYVQWCYVQVPAQ